MAESESHPSHERVVHGECTSARERGMCVIIA